MKRGKEMGLAAKPRHHTRDHARAALHHDIEQDHYDDSMVAKIVRAANAPPVDKPMSAEDMIKAIAKGE